MGRDMDFQGAKSWVRVDDAHSLSYLGGRHMMTIDDVFASSVAFERADWRWSGGERAQHLFRRREVLMNHLRVSCCIGCNLEATVHYSWRGLCVFHMHLLIVERVVFYRTTYPMDCFLSSAPREFQRSVLDVVVFLPLSQLHGPSPPEGSCFSYSPPSDISMKNPLCFAAVLTEESRLSFTNSDAFEVYGINQPSASFRSLVFQKYWGTSSEDMCLMEDSCFRSSALVMPSRFGSHVFRCCVIGR